MMVGMQALMLVEAALLWWFVWSGHITVGWLLVLAAGYGVLLASVGIGGLAGALFLASVGQRFRRGTLLTLSSLAFCVLLIVFSLVRSVALAQPLLLLAGFTMILNSALSNGALQTVVPDAYRGRLMSAYSFVVVGLSQVVGAFVAGGVARLVGVDWAIGGAAVLMLAYTLWAFAKYPELGRL
jgi:MFS family permease